MERRISSPKQALDYPTLPGDLVVIWTGNEHVWPDGRRQTNYLSSTQTDAMKGYALFTSNIQDAKVFPTREEAHAWLISQQERRGHPYHSVSIGTVKELIALRFPA